MIWDPENECMDPEQRRELQLHRLRSTVARLAANVPFYQQRFAEADVSPLDLKSVDDLRYLPFTTKDDLRETYPTGMIAVPLSELVRIHSSSGTTGTPVIAGYTRRDVDIWAETIARTICLGGGTSADILQVAYGYGLFTGGLGLHYGGERVGCTVIPMSAGNTARQVMMMRDLKSTMLACTPSYALTIADEIVDSGMDIEQLHLRNGLFGAEVWSDSSRAAIESTLNIKAHDIYGLTEIIGPGVSAECGCSCGLHICDDHFIPEIIDPETREVLPAGERGELVFTCITKEAFPVIRFRTRDITTLHYEKCECGRTTTRMDRVTGRDDDMLIIRGVNVFPSQIENVLVNIEETLPHYQLVITKEGRLDVLEVQVEVSSEIFADTIRGLEAVEDKIRRELASALSIQCRVKLVEPKSIERSIGKAKRVIDLREE
ncbi:MAG TPA: phenylacetate--CoA ligase [Armatimonadetes bacterium]|jgi:phenylacetate-CoA ligase|nr:phenylacetate--CoA ligase [Armatimonadota bacterium]